MYTAVTVVDIAIPLCAANSFILSHPSPVVPALEWSNDITLSCSASGVPLPNITWEKEGGATPPTTTMFTTPGGTPNSVSEPQL